MLKAIVIYILLITYLNAESQTCCTAGAPISTSLEISKTAAKIWNLQLGYEYKSINTLVEDDNVLNNDDRSRFGQSLTLKLDYSLSDKIAFSMIAPVVHQSRNTFSAQENSLGIGDLSIISQYALINKREYDWIIAAGLKVPTGKNNHKDDSMITLSPDMQSGSGSVDFLLRSAFVKENMFAPFLTGMASILFRSNGTNHSFAESQNFEGRQFAFGDELIGQLGLKYLLVSDQGFIIPDLSLKFRSSSPNLEQGFDAANSGGDWISIPWGVSFVPDETKAVRLYMEHPVYQKLEGLQITSNFTVGLQFNYRLNNKNIL